MKCVKFMPIYAKYVVYVHLDVFFMQNMRHMEYVKYAKIIYTT